MTKALYLTPSGPDTGLTSTCIGLVRALDQLGIKAGFCKPIEQKHEDDTGPERSTYYISSLTSIEPPEPISGFRAKQMLVKGKREELFEEIIGKFRQASLDADIVIVEGLVTTRNDPYGPRLNSDIAKTIDAEIILVAAPGHSSFAELSNRLEMTTRLCGENKVLGCILNNVNAPKDTSLFTINNQPEHEITKEQVLKECDIFKRKDFKLIGFNPWQQALAAPRAIDLVKFLGAKRLHEGALENRRVTQLVLGGNRAPALCDNMKAGTFVITPGDREDIILLSCLAAMNGIPLAGLLLTDGLMPSEELLHFAEPAMATGMPILKLNESLHSVAHKMFDLSLEVPVDDSEKINKVMSAMAEGIDKKWLKQFGALRRETRLSPAAFRYLLVEEARHAKKRIVLPEGEEPRTIQAAAMCEERKIAHCILLGKEEVIQRVAEANDIQLPVGLEIIDPEEVKAKYIKPMVELRKNKGLNVDMAEALLEDPIVVGTMMLALDEVDGLVAGAVNTTAHTIRPALQLIKTKANTQLVSSIFFMCLPEQVLVYGDCAVNPAPNPEQLADIAIQSADSAKRFGIEPRVAMISYSTGVSGSGQNVEKVAQATKLAKAKRPDLMIDGPLQYDAAAIESVAKKKAPNSPVAGRATVFVFPDLNTGNTTYKAVQRSANVVSIGPMLQGLKKPVNDLSRGALVDDIVYTIALTCIQAK